MEWLNYHHLRYFWTVAKEGSLKKAAEKLHVSQPSISGQLSELEDALGEQLFRRSGRSKVLTDAGQIAFRYADEIFTLGRELVNAVKQRPTAQALRLYVGMADSLPKLVTNEILKPVNGRQPDKHFRVTLSNPTNAVLGPYATATITILDTTGMRPHRFEGVAALPDGSVRLALGGGVHTRFKDYYDLYPIEVSSNLVHWTPLVTLQRTNADTNALTYTDTATGNWPVRFYRTPATNLITPFSVQPSGPYAVGVRSRLLTDPSRRNRYNLSTNGSFMVLIWYPAVVQAGRLPGPLLDAPIAQDPFFGEQLHHIDDGGDGYPATNIVDRTRQMVGYAMPDAPWATNLAPCPILLCSPQGYGWRACWAEKAANLASHGYVVVVSDPSDGVATVWPDGTYLTLPHISYAWTETALNDRVRDMTLILDELTRCNVDDPVFAGRLDVANAASMGGCWGFPPAAEFCRSDPRCKATILVACDPEFWPGGDVAPLPQLKTFGPGKPSLVVYSDYPPGIPGYPDASESYHWIFHHTERDAVAFLVQGAGDIDWPHGYGAMILLQDFSLLLEPYRQPVGRDGARIIADYSLWFLNKYLKGRNDPVPPPANYPRILGFLQK